jgi:hypothetical protein
MSEQRNFDMLYGGGIRLLNLYYKTSNMLKGRIFPNGEIGFFQGLAFKFYSHAASTLMVARGTSLLGANPPVNLGDGASVMVLCRATLENYGMFHYLFLDPKISDDDSTFRMCYAVIQGLLPRQISTRPESAKLRAEERAEIDAMLVSIKATNFYKNLSKNQQKQVDIGKHKVISKQKMIEEAGVSSKNTKIIYSYTSDYAHSGYVGLAQMGQADTAEKQREIINNGLLTLNTTLALAINAFVVKYSLEAAYDLKPGEDPRLADNKDLVEGLCSAAADDTLIG